MKSYIFSWLNPRSTVCNDISFITFIFVKLLFFNKTFMSIRFSKILLKLISRIWLFMQSWFSSATIKKLEVTLTKHMLPTLKFILGWRSVKNIEKGQGRPNIPNNRHVTRTINPFGIGMADCSCGNLTSWLLFCPWDCTSCMWPYQLWEIFSAETSSLIEFFVARWTSRSMVEVRVSSFQ